MEDTLKELLTHIWDKLTDKPGRTVITPGLQSAWDDCCSGQLSARLVSSQLVYNQQRCPFAVDYLIEVEMVRCVAVVDDDGEAPEAYEITHDGVRILQDMREVGCALLSYEPTDPAISRFNASEYSPVGLEGGCGGGKWTVSLRSGLSWLR